MKKIICLLLSLVVAVAALTACSGGFSGVKDYSGEVSSNGGFVVQKGDYVYFVNGKDDSTADNAFGKPVKGALVRAKLSEVNDLGTMPEVEVVVPKLFYTEYDLTTSGFYIFGDYVYYASPSTSRDKTGTVLNSQVDFLKTKLDGTGTKVLATCDSLSAPYKFVANGDNVYLTVYTTDTNDDDEEINVFVTYDKDGKKVFESKAVSSYIFSADGSAAYAYYEKKAYNEGLEADEDFSEVYRYSLTGEGETLVLSGASMYSTESGIGTQGVTYSFIKLTADALYLSESYVDTSVSTITRYYGVELADLVENTAHDKLVLLNKGTSDAASIFTANSVYVDLDTIIFNHSTYGLVCYDYNNQDDIKTFGLEQLIFSEDLMSYTYCFDDGEYMYYDDGTYFYRISIADVLTGVEDVHQITYTTTSGISDFYKFEIIGNVLFILNAYDPFYDYVCAYDITVVDNIQATDALTKEEAVKEFLDEFATSDREHVLKRLGYRIGKLNTADQETLDNYLDENYPEDSSSS